MKIERRRVMVVAAALMLGGCASVIGGGQKSVDTYDLVAPSELGTVGTINAQILIPPPSAVASLASDRIVIRPKADAITYLGGAQWSDTLPNLLQARLLETFQQAGKVRRVGRTGEGLVADYQILVNIRDFYADPSAGVAKVEIGVRLVTDRSGRILATRTFTQNAPLVGETSDAIVGAMNRAMGAAIADIVRWTASRL